MLKSIVRNHESFESTEWMLIFPNKGGEITFYPISSIKMLITVLDKFSMPKRLVVVTNQDKRWYLDREELIADLVELEDRND
jgi:hypothetical protein